METKPTYQELETMNARLTEQLSKALTAMTEWKQKAALTGADNVIQHQELNEQIAHWKNRAINSERKVTIAKIELQNEIDRLTLTNY
jgi:hypothetical protein